MSSKLEAAAAKTVVADTAVHDGIIGEMVGERDQEVRRYVPVNFFFFLTWVIDGDFRVL